LNAALSRVRSTVKADRPAVLAADPLWARMRLSADDPPLKTCFLELEQDAGVGHIRMKVKLAGTFGSLTGLSLTVPFAATASDAICLLPSACAAARAGPRSQSQW
jgi:hypothetical protein